MSDPTPSFEMRYNALKALLDPTGRSKVKMFTEGNTVFITTKDNNWYGKSFDEVVNKVVADLGHEKVSS